MHNMVSCWVFSFKLPGTVLKELDRIFSNFIWNNNMHAWKEVCRPKDEGGCGIRRLLDINQASGVRLAWRLCTSKSLWAQWMRIHYLHGNHISQAEATLLDSGTWKWIGTLKAQTLASMVRTEGDGSSISDN